MVDYTLTVESEPSGIAMQILALDKSYWITTDTTLTFPAGTVITVLAPYSVGQPIGTTEKGFRFEKWENGSTDVKRTLTLTANTTIKATYTKLTYFPVRNMDRRKQKYEAKVNDEVYQIRTIALKPMMVEQQEATTSEQAAIELTLSKILHPKGLSGIIIHHYRNFSQELYSLKKRFTSESLNTEASILAKKWKARGLDPDILTEIAEAFGITITF